METIATWTASDGYRGLWRHFEPPGTHRADIIYLHGIQSHGGWYGSSCQRLAGLGYRVGFLDRRGSGLNFHHRGDAPSWQRLVADVFEFRQQFVGNPPRPCFLLAVSWGAKVAAAIAARWPWLFQGIILIGPGFFPQVAPPLATRLRILAARLLRPAKQFPIPLNDPELFTATAPAQAFLRDDALALRTATARLLVESVWLDRHLRGLARRLRLPTLLMLGEHDRIIHNGPTRRWVAGWNSPDVTLRVIPGGHHTLEFEADAQSWFSHLAAWLETRALHSG
ncbi:MAG TPA: alpha/beta hydrolase [Gemmatales bacterium]|nr:alpha/beta hydrolase [Gemmatales bacterium]HMP60525.1 alpha/beta hydrolase [Gemmatales bacterium]